MEEAKKKSSPVCSKCGEKSRYIEYSTFSYYFCGKCKEEVKPEEEKKPKRWSDGHWLDSLAHSYNSLSAAVAVPNAVVANVPLTQPHPAYASSNSPGLLTPPPGYAACAGEYVTCQSCGLEHGYLLVDTRPAGDYGRVTQGTLWDRTDFFLSSCCSNPQAVKFDPVNSHNIFHVKGRGWV